MMAHGIRPIGPFVCVLVGSRPVELPLPLCFKSYQDFTLMLFLSFNS